MPLIAAAILLAACQDKKQTNTPAESPAETAWTVHIRGYGPIHAGMTLAEAAASGVGRFGELMMGSEECDYVLFTGDTIRGNAHVMVVHGRIARVDISDSTISTAEGARIGDPEQRIHELYPGRVRVEPHKYTDGHYLVVTPGAPADSGHAIIFETDGQNVTTYRAGRQPEVRYIEGCS